MKSSVKLFLVFLLLLSFLLTITSVQEVNQLVWYDRTAGPHRFQHTILSPYPPLPIIVGIRLFEGGFFNFRTHPGKPKPSDVGPGWIRTDDVVLAAILVVTRKKAATHATCH